jgi:putative acetyltransferase
MRPYAESTASSGTPRDRRTNCGRAENAGRRRAGVTKGTKHMVVAIRRAYPHDGEPIRRMVFEVLREYGLAADPDDSDADVMDFGNSKVPAVVHLVAEVDGEAVGSAILTPYDAHRVKLSKLFLRKDQRGAGLGRRMLTASVEAAREAGYAEIFLTTRAVYREAVALYEACDWLRGPDQPAPGPDRLYYLPLREAALAHSGVLAAEGARQ